MFSFLDLGFEGGRVTMCRFREGLSPVAARDGRWKERSDGKGIAVDKSFPDFSSCNGLSLQFNAGIQHDGQRVVVVFHGEPLKLPSNPKE